MSKDCEGCEWYRYPMLMDNSLKNKPIPIVIMDLRRCERGWCDMERGEIKLPIHVNFPDDWIEQIVNRLRNDPEAEWVEIVRCKDCKWSDISAMGHLAVCNHARGLMDPSPNSYCNFAERRTDETD